MGTTRPHPPLLHGLQLSNADCPNPGRAVLSDAAQDSCPIFSNNIKQAKSSQAATTTETTDQPTQPATPRSGTTLTPQPSEQTTLHTQQSKDVCPKSHEQGSLQPKEILNKKGGRTHTHWYHEHYDPTKKSKYRYCYIGKTRLPDLQRKLQGEEGERSRLHLPRLQTLSAEEGQTQLPV